VNRDDESDRRVSGGELQGFPDDVEAGGIFTGKCPVRLKDERYGFFEVRAGFVQGCPLRVGARQLLDVRDVATGNRSKHGGELDGHGAMLPPSGYGV